MNPAAGGALTPTNPLVQFAPIILIVIVFYFLILRPQQQKQRETQAMLDNLKVNDEVVTTGGLFGRIVKLADKVVTLEIAPKIQVRIERTAIAGLQRSTRSGDKEKTGEEKSA
jgi:preprotein translocase subunit YajC